MEEFRRAQKQKQKESLAATTGSSLSGTFADREIVQLQIDQTTEEMQDYINASGGRAEDSVLDWYDRQLRNLNRSLNNLPTEARREDILLQALGGNYYTGKPTLGGTAAQASLGVLGLDAPADFRDLTYDLNHRDSIPKSQLALDALALLPLVGGLKYVDDAAGGIKAAAKQADNLMDTGGHARYNGVKLSNQEVREWYVSHVTAISDSIDNSLPLEEQAKLAFEARNSLRTQAREMMLDSDTRAMLDEKRPNRTFDELLKDKMDRKGMSKEEALLDIYHTATKSNEKVNKLFGLGG